MATFTVTNTADSGAGSLRQAVLDANALHGRDAIVFAASFDGGTEDVIRLTGGQIEITGTLRIDGGPGVTITGDAAGDDMTNAAGITDVAASGAGRLDDNSRIFDTAHRLTLDGLTLTGGRTTADDREEVGGGAVRSTGARLTLIDSVVNGNSTVSGNSYADQGQAKGGGIYALHDVTVSDSTVSGNSVFAYNASGGGIFGENVTVMNSKVRGNSSTAGNFADGGGIYGLRDVTVSNSIISGNSADGHYGGSGGGIRGDDVTVRNSAINGNDTYAFGGGIAGDFVTLESSTVSGNRCNHGGGGIIGSYDVTVRNSTVSGNSASEYGGGIKGTNVTAVRSTVSGNSAGFGGGGGIWIPDEGGEYGTYRVHLTNSIVLGNRASNTGADEIFGPQALKGGNIVGADVFSGMSDIGNTTAGKVFDATRAIVDGVRAGRLADNGGPTRTIALNPDASNPALGAADAGKAPARDQRGLPRDAAPDLGAFEAGPVDGLVLLGRARAERLTGSALDDQIYGRDGNDRLLGRAGGDQLRGEFGHDRLRGSRGEDWLDGGAGRDGLKGGWGSDRLSGGAGDDHLRGQRGSDRLSGGPGDDHLRGDPGDDRLLGGTGSDTFVFAGDFGHDAIEKFDARPARGQDRIDLRAFGISPGSFDDSVLVEDLGDDTRISMVGGGTILCRGVSGDGTNTIDEADFLL